MNFSSVGCLKVSQMEHAFHLERYEYSWTPLHHEYFLLLYVDFQSHDPYGSDGTLSEPLPSATAPAEAPEPNASAAVRTKGQGQAEPPIQVFLFFSFLLFFVRSHAPLGSPLPPNLYWTKVQWTSGLPVPPDLEVDEERIQMLFAARSKAGKVRLGVLCAPDIHSGVRPTRTSHIHGPHVRPTRSCAPPQPLLPAPRCRRRRSPVDRLPHKPQRRGSRKSARSRSRSPCAASSSHSRS